ncbi:aminotransferase class III-fold pyridoxal phosphate-dependent enzyme [Ulvibacterium marinum]|uniref:aminotransferase class III-fold pyridoxal phosphate-dependent enzyme n=1 Tax=Ulvibacterium marinum TaxID=2419782 RepID=UPI002494633F|nr:aminotransferase class III-fold pyridoxal phosphate-dependent enzyme [Ulvibacterium marinum]
MEEILSEYYGLNQIRLTPLEGYDSINFKVEAKGKTHVLKQYPYSDATQELLHAENRVLVHLSKLQSIDFPKPINTKDGKELVLREGLIFRLLSYVEGDFLGNIEHTPRLLKSLGEFLGKMDRSLLKCHEASLTAKETQWDLKHFMANEKYLKFIPDNKDRSLVDYFFLQFLENVCPHQYELRKSLIHNDANDWNVLTRDGKVSGIIDFGDMCHSWTVNEIAIAITYVMMGKEKPLEVASHVIEGYQSIFPLETEELDILYYLVAARLCTSVCNSAYAKTLKPESEYITISEKPAWRLLRKWLGINPIKCRDAFRMAAGYPKVNKPKLREQLEKRSLNLGKALSLSYINPIQMQRSAFQYMYDGQGNTILDAYNNIMLAGHCHPKVVRAGRQVMARLNTNTRYVFPEILAYSETLLSKFPQSLDKVFFVNSGSAATDLAIRMALAYSKKKKIMVLEHGYHGNTRVGIDISHYKYGQGNNLGKQDYIVETPMPKVFGSGLKDDGSAGKHFAQETMARIDGAKGKIAAFIAEPIMGCGGQVPLAKGYLKEVYPKIRAQGGICISDEVQVGFGRLGDFFWGYEMHEIVPDMVILGKPMANGHPIGAVVTTSEISESFAQGPEFFSSFGGNPVSCTIGHAVLQVIQEEKLQEHAKKVGDYLQSLLVELQQEFLEIANIRGIGLFIGVELLDKKGKPNTMLAHRVKNELRENYILIGTDGPYDNVLKIKPPLSFSEKDADLLVHQLHKICNDLLN